MDTKNLNHIVSIQGQRGSFHHIVASKLFGHDVNCHYRATFREVMADVDTGKSTVGIMAIENSIAGSLIMNYDLLAKHPVPIVGEVVLRIAQHLIAKPGVNLEGIREVWSHPMAIEQCRDFLDQFPAWKVIESEDTAGSVADMAKSSREDVGVIASDYAAQIYGMTILQESIETDPQNYTRFLILSRTPLPNHLTLPAIRSSFRFSTKNEPGSLLRVLEVFEEFGVNLSKLESRPIVGKPWEYQFYCDATIGNSLRQEDPSFFQLLTNLKDVTQEIQPLGSYPDWTMIDVRKKG